jgi:2,3-bisphosphoglycerate-independent phosphoglycerate mutase
LIAALNHAEQHQSKLHLVGMISDGLVHSDIRFLYALLKLCRRHQIKQVYIHAITDGIDVPPHSALTYLTAIKKHTQETGVGQVVTIGGRYYGMDRAHNYERTAKAYHAMVHGIGPYEKTPEEAVKRAYQYGLNDDMIEPTVITDTYLPRALVADGDAFIFFNLRSDRTRQLTKPFVLPDFKFFDRGPQVKDLFFLGMTNFGDDLPMSIAYLNNRLINPLPEYLGKTQNLAQLYIAEEEKFSHVAYFFHGGSSIPYEREQRIMIPSPKIKNYAEKPEMSAGEVTARVKADLQKQKSQFILINYANPDIIGHTGDLKAAITALEFLDPCVKDVTAAVLKQNGRVIVTADHGNCEEMIDPKTKAVLRSHTTNPVPFTIVSDDPKIKHLKLAEGILGNVSPSVLKLMNCNPPREMTCPPLF